MRTRPLYHLPTFGRMEFRRIAFGALGLYILALTLLCWFFTQRFAWQLDFHPNLAAPWLKLPTGYTRLLTLIAAGAALTALVFAFIRTLRRGAIPLLAVAFLHATLALGPLYTPFHFLVWA